MAHGSLAPAGQYRPEMDGQAHEATYNRFTHFTAVAGVFVACIVVALAVGGAKHGWISAIVMVLLAHVATGIGLASATVSWRAPGVVLAILALMLLLY